MVFFRRFWTFVNWLFWVSLLFYFFFRFFVNMISSGFFFTLVSFVFVFFVGKWRVGGSGGVSDKGRV